MKTYKVIDLFAGAGGLTLGFADTRFCGGFSPVLAVENDRAATLTHEANFSARAICGNIEAWLDSRPKIPEADVVIGGPPCQGFSLLNKKRDGDIRRALWEPFLDVVRMSGARIFVMENVAELFRSTEFIEIRKRAEDLGFVIQASILNSADYGAAQVRKRTIIIGRLAGQPDLQFPPPPTHSDPAVDSSLPRWRTVRDEISNLPPRPIGTEIRSCKPPLNLHFGRTPTEMSLRRYKAVPPGGNRFDLQRNLPELTPACWVRKVSGSTDLFGRLWWDRPAVTIRTEFFKPEKGRYLHPEQDRPITHREAARLMGFPDNFRFVGSKIEIARQIGNAVPPPLAGAIARSVKSALDDADTNKSRRPISNNRSECRDGETIPA
jgi:DNA (cytosine-5)-methyltransferase 1